MQCIGDSSPPPGGTLDPFNVPFPVDGFEAIQAARAWSLKSSPYLNTAQASRAFFAAMATTAFQ